MSIRDFYSSFISVQTENTLFQALRKLSQLDDAQSLLTPDEDETILTWGEWSASRATS